MSYVWQSTLQCPIFEVNSHADICPVSAWRSFIFILRVAENKDPHIYIYIYEVTSEILMQVKNKPAENIKSVASRTSLMGGRNTLAGWKPAWWSLFALYSIKLDVFKYWSVLLFSAWRITREPKTGATRKLYNCPLIHLVETRAFLNGRLPAHGQFKQKWCKWPHICLVLLNSCGGHCRLEPNLACKNLLTHVKESWSMMSLFSVLCYTVYWTQWLIYNLGK